MAIAAVLVGAGCDLVVRGGGGGEGRSGLASSGLGLEDGGSGGEGGSGVASSGGSGGEGGSGVASSGAGAGGGGGEGGTPGTCVPGAVLTCYTGPAGTAGIGACVTGTQTCRTDGLGYGPCTGAVAPAAEICASPVDEDCDGDPQCPRLSPWARAYGGPGDDSGLSIVSDAWGNYYVSGAFEGTVDFGAGPLTSAGESDVFLLKLDPSGSVIWSRRFGTVYNDWSATLTIDDSGNIYFAGLYEGEYPYYDGGPDFGGGSVPPIEQDTALFLVKLDPEGNHIWSNGLVLDQGSYLERVQAIAVDGVGDVFVLYLFYESYVVAKVSAGGQGVLWRHYLPGFVSSSGVAGAKEGGLAVDGDDNVLVAHPDDFNIFWPESYFNVTKLSPTGALLWERQFPSAYYGDRVTLASSVAVNAAGEILVTGAADSSIGFGGGSGDGAAPVLVKLDAAGEVISSRTIPHHKRLVLDPAGGMFVAGSSGIAKLDDSGTTLWSVGFTIPSQSWYMPAVEGIAISPNGTVAIAGTMFTPMDFGTGPLPYTAGGDMFVATFNP
ncbi:hypothetical protein [Sorangium sp. So ce1335]|uniref:hypothetical protein n=1 Tax=Sorangium sp. So ce1335 TaxID=3133335 RepID=UPI003F5E3C91